MLNVDFDWVCEFIQEKIKYYIREEGSEQWPDNTMQWLLDDLKDEYYKRVKENEDTEREE